MISELIGNSRQDKELCIEKAEVLKLEVELKRTIKRYNGMTDLLNDIVGHFFAQMIRHGIFAKFLVVKMFKMVCRHG